MWKAFPPVTREELVHLFSTFGTVLSADLARRPEGRSMGFAEVVMANLTEADNAMEALHRVYLHARLLLVFDDYAWTDRGPKEPSC